MAGRFQELYKLPGGLYCDGCPVIIAAGAIQKDNSTGRVLAQLKLRNLGVKKVISCKVSLWCHETSGRELEGITDHSYLDFVAEQGDDFGSKTPIYLPDSSTRKFTPVITEIVFSDKSLKLQYQIGQFYK